MNLDRMKFAWARGARLQWLVDASTADPYWEDQRWPYFDGDRPWRIYPNDAHLEYGPLSSAIRELSIFGTPQDRPFTNFERIALQTIIIELGDMHKNAMEWDCFSLMLAEYLADQGL